MPKRIAAHKLFGNINYMTIILEKRVLDTLFKKQYFTLVSDMNDMGGIVGRYPPEWVTPTEISDL